MKKRLSHHRYLSVHTAATKFRLTARAAQCLSLPRKLWLRPAESLRMRKRNGSAMICCCVAR